MSAPLYSLTGRYQQLLELAEQSADGRFDEALAALDDALEAKAVGVCKVLAQLDADAAAADSEAKRLAGRSKAYANSAERLRRHLKDCMSAAKLRSIKSPQFSITLSAGQDKVLITDVSKVPPELMRQPKTPPAEPDKVAILKWHAATGEVPPGCDIVPTHTLTVR